MNTRSKIVAAALGLLVAGGAVADASAATLVKKTVVAHHAIRPVVAHATVAKKTVTIVHRFHRPLHRVAAIRVLPGHRIAPRIHVAKAFGTKKIVKTTVVR